MKTQYTLRILLLIGIMLIINARESTCAEPPHSACDLDIIVPDDITICSAEDFDIDADINGDYLEFFWTQDGEFLTDSDLNPTVYIEGTTTFTLTAYQLDEENLIINGDFESGDWIEYTDYYEGDGNCTSGLGYLACEGTYGVIDNPNLGHVNFDPCPDHTGGGSMMVVNGASSFQQIWCQTINVEPDGIYAFTAWAASVNPASPAQLQFAIDGTLIGNLFSLTGTTCQWEEFTAEWEASGQTSVEICVTNQNTAASGNDFALDDIAFHEICESSNTFTVTYAAFDADWNTPDDIDCVNTESEIEIFLDGDYDYSIEWETDDGNIVLEQNDGTYILVDEPAIYMVTITNEFDCEEDLNIEVESDTLSPQMILDKSNDLNCQDQDATLTADAIFSGIDITWYDSTGTYIIEDDEIEVNASGWYLAEAYDDDNGCITLDSIFVMQDTMAPDASLTLSNPLNCNYNSSTLSLNTSFPSIVWVNEMDTVAIDVDSIDISQGGVYTVIVEGTNYCVDSTNIMVNEESAVFEYVVDFEELIDCNNPVSELSIDYDSSTYELKFEDENLLPDSLIAIQNSGTYHFEIIDANGCSEVDSINIVENFDVPLFTLTGDTISCQEPSALLSINTQSATVDWTTPSGQSYSGDSLETAVPGLYQVLVTGSNGCTSKDSFELTSSELIPELTIEGDTLTCYQSSIELLAQSNQTDLSYDWTLPDNTNEQAEMLTTSSGGLYSLVVTNSVGCSATAEYLVVEFFNTPEIPLLPDVILDCNTSTFESDLNLLIPVDSIQWNGPGVNSNEVQIMLEQGGTYYVEVFGINGCSAIDSFQVALDTLSPSVNILPVPEITCLQSEVMPVIEAMDSITSYAWTGPNFNSDEAEIMIDVPGAYSLQVTGTNGCSNYETFVVEADTLAPQFDFTNTIINCDNPESTISIQSNPLIENSALFIEGILIEEGLEFMTPPVSEAYIEVTGTNGCKNEKLVEFEFDTLAIPIDAYAPFINCQMEPIQLEVLNEPDYVEITLAMAGNQIEYINNSITEPGLYDITAISQNGCLAQSQIEVEIVDDAPEILSLNETRLNCEDAVLLDYIDIMNGTAPYEIIVDGNPYTVSAIPIKIEGAGLHNIEIRDAYGCEDETTINIEALEPLVLDLVPNISIQEGQEVQLELEIQPDLNLVQSIQWSPSEYLSCDDCVSPLVQALNDINYEVLVLDLYGCESRANVSIDVNKIHKVYIPNVISLGDFRNDRFRIFFGDGDVKRVNYLNIYDRWGNLVFSAEDFDPTTEDIYWDGNFDDKPVLPGVYVFMTELLMEDDENEFFVGDITVLK